MILLLTLSSDTLSGVLALLSLPLLPPGFGTMFLLAWGDERWLDVGPPLSLGLALLAWILALMLREASGGSAVPLRSLRLLGLAWGYLSFFTLVGLRAEASVRFLIAAVVLFVGMAGYLARRGTVGLTGRSRLTRAGYIVCATASATLLVAGVSLGVMGWFLQGLTIAW